MLFGLEMHPYIVHFPIALSVVGTAAAIAYLVLRKEWLRWFAPVLLSLALLGGIAAYFSGESAEDRAEHVGVPEDVIQLHEERGIWGLWLLALACFLAWLTHATGRGVWIAALATVIATSVILYAGHVGATLVFRYGAGRVGPATPAGGGTGGERTGGEASGEHDD